VAQPNPLEQLHPLIPAPAISWWPLAIGWWVLLVLVIALVVIAIRACIRRYKKNAWRRQALIELALLREHYATIDQSDNPQLCAANTSVAKLIRRCLFSHDPSTDYRTLTAEHFSDVLAKQLGALQPEQQATLSTNLYAPTQNALPGTVFVAIEHWIKRV